MTDQATANARKTAYKAELLLKIGLASGMATAFASRVRMVKAATDPRKPHRIMCEDGGWIEIDPAGGAVRTWGGGRTAREIAHYFSAAKPSDWRVEHLEPTAIAAAPDAPRRAAPILSADQAKTLADRWRAKGFTDITEDANGVWVALDSGPRLFDTGTRVEIHGGVTDEAIGALVEKAREEWGAGLRLFGTWTDADRASVWLQCQRAGVALDEYEPTAELVARWEAERGAVGTASGQALRPDGSAIVATAGPMPPVTDGSGATELEPEAESPAEPDLTAFDRQAASLDRRAADIDQRQRMTIKERVDALQREQRLDLRAAQAKAFEQQDELRRAEAKIEEARAILARARALAAEKGLDYESAVAVARAEHLAEQEYQPRAGLRR